jgi:hypothetical protein
MELLPIPHGGDKRTLMGHDDYLLLSSPKPPLVSWHRAGVDSTGGQPSKKAPPIDRRQTSARILRG